MLTDEHVEAEGRSGSTCKMAPPVASGAIAPYIPGADALIGGNANEEAAVDIFLCDSEIISSLVGL